MIFSRRRSIYTLLSVASLLLVGGALVSRLRAQESRELTQIAPGVTLLSVASQSKTGPLRYWLIKADKNAAKLALEVADGRDVIKKKTVREIAAQSGALVAINGGFFAYNGAAVGAVKAGGEWQRLPWKSRTALAWNEKEARIGALSGVCQLVLTLDDGTKQTVAAALNGFALPGTHAAFSDGFAVLTPRFGEKLRLKLGAGAASFVGGEKVSAAPTENPAAFAIPANGFALFARGKALETLARIQKAEWKAVSTPTKLDRFPNILGAGPLLIQNGIVKTTEKLEEFRPDVTERGPRTAVGFDALGNTLFLVADGRQAASIGLTLPETAQLFQQLGAVSALNLDGGSSTQLVIGGELINAPSGYDPANPFRQREVTVSNALVLKTTL